MSHVRMRLMCPPRKCLLDNVVDCPLFLLPASQSFLGHGTLTDPSEGCPFVHGHVIGLVALDQILRRFFRGPDRVILKFDWGSDHFLDRSAYAACFRVPAYVIPDLEFMLHLSLPVLKTGVPCR